MRIAIVAFAACAAPVHHATPPAPAVDAPSPQHVAFAKLLEHGGELYVRTQTACEPVVFAPIAVPGDKLGGTIRFPVYEDGDRGTMQYTFDTYRDGEELLRLSGPSITYPTPNHAEGAYGCVGDADVSYDGNVIHIVPHDHQAVVAQTLYPSLAECNRASIVSPILAVC